MKNKKEFIAKKLSFVRKTDAFDFKALNIFSRVGHKELFLKKILRFRTSTQNPKIKHHVYTT